jgi:hypothetical protein
MHAAKTFLAALMLAAPAAAQTPDITPAEFERLHQDIRPRPGESPWTQIPWTYDLHKARKLAAEQGKPLCVWRMAGDPTAAC